MSKPVHSPKGASSAERWMNCPGSVGLIASIKERHPSADPEYRTEGTAAHDAISYCLTGGGHDAWEIVGEKFGEKNNKVEITVDIADAIQVFIDECNALAEGAECMGVETHLQHPEEKDCYGTADFWAKHPGVLYVRDYKHGMGIVVETKENPQMLYYAYLVLLQHPDVRKVNMHIVQPRIPFEHTEEPWEVDAEYVIDWGEKVLLPAMKRTQTDNTLCPGQHCRFCDAKEYLICPALDKQREVIAQLDPDTIKTLDDAELLMLWPTLDTVKMHLKALGDEVLRRLIEGKLKENGKIKLVQKKANRVWKAEAPALFASRFGDKAMNPAYLKSPAEMEKIDLTAKKLVHEYAYTPQSGYTVAAVDDKRPAVVLQTATEAFKMALDSVGG